jgi:hypothetical protein
MPTVCLVAQKPRGCAQEYVIIEGADKGRRCRDRHPCPCKTPPDFARDRPKSGRVRESRSRRRGPMSQDPCCPPIAVFADHASPHRADHVAPELGAKPDRAGATLGRTASVSACLWGYPGCRLITLFRLSFTKIPSAWIRAMRQNQRIIRRDACHTTEAARRAGKDALKELLNKLFT